MRSVRLFAGQNSDQVKRKLLHLVAQLIRRNTHRNFAEPTWLTNDPAFVSQLQALQELALVSRESGADLRPAATAIATHSFLRRWLYRSDALVDELTAPLRLKGRRRRGILRHIDGALRGLPFFQPPLVLYRTHDSPQPRIFPLWDELEWIVLPGRMDQLGWRPAKDEINFDEARAWTGMKSATLYHHTWKRDVPGQTWRALGGDAESNLREVRFQVEAFRRWTMISEVRGATRMRQQRRHTRH